MPESPTPANVNRVDSPIQTGVSAGFVRSSQVSLRHSRWVKAQPIVEIATSPKSELRTQRIDTSHANPPRDAEFDTLAHDQPESQAQRRTQTLDRDAWLQLHAAELIRRLQLWANGLDAREADLNAAYARQDLRERRFRLQQMEFQSEMAEARRAAEDLQHQIDAQSRRLAFESLA